MNPTRRDLGRYAFAVGMLGLSISAESKQKPAIKKSGNYSYRVRFSRRPGGRISVWTYVANSQSWNSSVPFALLVSTAPTDLSSEIDPNSKVVVFSKELVSGKRTSHTNRHTFKIPDPKAKRLFVRILIGPEHARSRVWPIQLQA